MRYHINVIYQLISLLECDNSLSGSLSHGHKYEIAREKYTININKNFF